ncbi:hypothetical protein A6F68_02379 [Tsuneonella dongtanensis]|uniref:Bacterial sensory transduction regulator n=1 Tax=Tsuneonella dongtanensis TaxID=692370 RepID=A0A1B2AFK6_9SPHN|nr:YbjN domain-containing protein [Tsuneonella dongtanensis]ANY20878.1 hypothetical protein A6F68_02379 [Tsuneonella dongtanensis]
MRASVLIAFGLALAPAATFAADETVAASNPDGIVRVLRESGFSAELDKDSYGDPLIKTSFAGYPGSIYFYGCAAETHEGCESLQFRAGLDRKTPLTPELTNAIVKKYRFTALWLDDDGDPWVNFDLFTGSGIARENFMRTLKAFEQNFGSIANDVFAEERGE